jgi:ribosomal protein S18 acetylase RimI-like enzyme
VTVTRRDYAGPADLRRMQDLVSSLYQPDANWHIGDLAWQRYQHVGREAEWRTALWEDDGAVVGWGWVRLPGLLLFTCRPGYPEVADAILAWFGEVATGSELTTETMVEPYLAQALERAGFTVQPDPDGLVRLLHPLTGLAPVRLPDGYRVRHVTPADLDARVAVHRAAFAPSRVTPQSYANVMAAWPYRPELDWVVQVPDGQFGASCLIWYDEAAGVGELEPVGTHPGYRRLGLARAACLAALHALRDLGGREAFVLAHDRPDQPAALALYRSLGFHDHARTLTWRLRRPAG